MAATPWDLLGGTAVITGAASGIGAALAQALATRGHRLALVDRDAVRLQQGAEALRQQGATVSTHALDLTDLDAIARLPEQVRAEHPRVNLLVNNAGVALAGTFEQVSTEDFDWLMSINFTAVVRMTRAFLPVLSRERAAALVNVSSIFGIVAPPGQTAYCASKFAVRGFTESLRHELEMARSPVRVTLVHPGGVRTAIAENARMASTLDDSARQFMRRIADRALVLPPEQAAARIVRGIERHEARVLVGRDASQVMWLQRLFPVTYWHHMARDQARRLRSHA